MKKFFGFSLLLITIFSFCSYTLAQDTPDIKWKLGGTVQAYSSYAQTASDTNQIGFGLRRVRVKVYADFSANIKSFVQFELTTPKLLDARLDYLISPSFNIRVGRFIGAGVRAGGLTSHTDIDIIDRSYSAEYWGKKTIGADFRDYGMAFYGKFDDFNYNFTIHNGNGALNLKPAAGATASSKIQGVAFSGMAFFKPASVKGLEAGGYYGMGNKYVNDYRAYNAYIYYEPSPFRVKAEYIGEVDKNGTKDVTFSGYYFLGAYKVTPNVELMGRYERFDPNTDVSNNEGTIVTIAASYSFFAAKWAAAKITAAYVLPNENPVNIDNNVFYVMYQLAF